jgi:hypothetical protein
MAFASEKSRTISKRRRGYPQQNRGIRLNDHDDLIKLFRALGRAAARIDYRREVKAEEEVCEEITKE